MRHYFGAIKDFVLAAGFLAAMAVVFGTLGICVWWYLQALVQWLGKS